jgi:hypothetical protein
LDQSSARVTEFSKRQEVKNLLQLLKYADFFSEALCIINIFRHPSQWNYGNKII